LGTDIGADFASGELLRFHHGSWQLDVSCVTSLNAFRLVTGSIMICMGALPTNAPQYRFTKY
jgi:hypothetical protein